MRKAVFVDDSAAAIVKKARAKAAREKLELLLLQHIRAAGLIEPERQYKFDATRKWRADFAWPGLDLLVEVDGGTWSGGRHTRGAGYEADCEKLNAAVMHRLYVLRFTGGLIKSGHAITTIAKLVPSKRDCEANV